MCISVSYGPIYLHGKLLLYYTHTCSVTFAMRFMICVYNYIFPGNFVCQIDTYVKDLLLPVVLWLLISEKLILMNCIGLS